MSSLIPQERWQRINEQSVEDSVEEFKIVSLDKFSERICERIVNVTVAQVDDAQDERQRIEERLIRTWNSPLPPDKEEFAEIRQLVARMSEFSF